MRRFGFTLAEVLITLSIIGVVSAMTLPSLNSNVQNRSIESATAKMYSVLNEATQRYMTDNGIESLGDINFDPEDFVESTLKVLTRCDNAASCFASEYKRLNNTVNNPLFANTPAYILKDGASIQIWGERMIFVDVNGVKGPNKYNRDTWMLRILPDGSIADRAVGDTIEEQDRNFEACREGNNQNGCFAHFVRNGFKFDY